VCACALLLCATGCGREADVPTTHQQNGAPPSRQNVASQVKPEGPAPLGLIDIYEAYAASPKQAREKYAGKSGLFRGTVAKTTVLGPTAVVFFEHSRGAGRARENQDRIVAVFDAGAGHDLGFALQKGQGGALVVPWRDGEPLTVQGTCGLGTRREGGQNVPEVHILQPKLIAKGPG
jgi:hypothetical protein